MPSRHAGLGNGQLGRVDDLVTEQQQVEVQGPLPPADRSGPAELFFDLLENAEQRKRVNSRLQHGGGVQVQPLTGRAADRFGLMERADLLENHSGRRGQGCESPFQGAPTVA